MVYIFLKKGIPSFSLGKESHFLASECFCCGNRIDILKRAQRKGENIESTPSSVLIMEPFISLET